MTPAEEISAAAKLMRERATAATPGPWEATGREVDQVGSDYAEVIGREVSCMTYCYGGSAVLPKQADAEFIASMHPNVALAVADWLDIEAAAAGRSLPDDSGARQCALRIARAYLGPPEPGSR